MFKTGLAVAVVLAGAACATGVMAWGNDIRAYGFKAAMEDPVFLARAPEDVKLYFADEPVTVKREVGPTKSSRKRPTPARKTPISTACMTTARDALIAMAIDARNKGGNAVVGIRSVTDGNTSDSRTQYQCAVGTQMLGVSLTGSIAEVE